MRSREPYVRSANILGHCASDVTNRTRPYPIGRSAQVRGSEAGRRSEATPRRLFGGTLIDSAAVARVFAIANQKGGVAKTTTTQTVGLALADLGERVLLVDLDPQACLTFALGLEPEQCTTTLHDVLLQRVKADDAIVDAGRVRLLAANIDLAGSEVHLLTRTGREHTLARALDTVRESYDTVLVDCPPSLGVLTVNGLTAADEVLVPLQCEALSHRGVAQLLDTITDVREFTNHRLACAA